MGKVKGGHTSCSYSFGQTHLPATQRRKAKKESHACNQLFHWSTKLPATRRQKSEKENQDRNQPGSKRSWKGEEKEQVWNLQRLLCERRLQQLQVLPGQAKAWRGEQDEAEMP